MGTVVWSTAFSVLYRCCVVLLSLPSHLLSIKFCVGVKDGIQLFLFCEGATDRVYLFHFCVTGLQEGRQAELLLFFTLSKYM